MNFEKIEIQKFGEANPLEMITNYPYAVGTQNDLLINEGEYKYGTHKDYVIKKCKFFVLTGCKIQFTGEYLGSKVIVTLFPRQENEKSNQR